MLIKLSRRTAICQSDAEVLLTGVARLGAVNHIFYVDTSSSWNGG